MSLPPPPKKEKSPRAARLGPGKRGGGEATVRTRHVHIASCIVHASSLRAQRVGCMHAFSAMPPVGLSPKSLETRELVARPRPHVSPAGCVRRKGGDRVHARAGNQRWRDRREKIERHGANMCRHQSAKKDVAALVDGRCAHMMERDLRGKRLGGVRPRVAVCM